MRKFWLLFTLFSSALLNAEDLKTPIDLGTEDPRRALPTSQGPSLVTLTDAQFDHEPQSEVLPRGQNGKYTVRFFEIINNVGGPREQYATGMLGAYVAVGDARVGFPIHTRVNYTSSETSENELATYTTKYIPVEGEATALAVKVVMRGTKLQSFQLTVPVLKKDGDGKLVYGGTNETLNLISARASKP